MDFLIDYSNFLLKTGTLVVAFLVVFAGIFALRAKIKKPKGQLEVRKINTHFEDLRAEIESALLAPEELKKLDKARRKEAKQLKKLPQSKPRVFLLDFEGDISASGVAGLREEVTALLAVATADDEVVVRLESAGGMVHGYGLAASQLARIRQAHIPLTICVDKVAASGGYLMACIGDRILAAPFAFLGSIGVVAQIPNVHRLLKKNDIDFEVLTAGQYKRTLTVFGDNTAEGRAKFQQDLELTHQLFKDFITQYRPQVMIEEVSTGEVWLGQAAFAKQLVDQVMTSDEYLVAKSTIAEIVQLHYTQPKSLPERLGLSMGVAAERTVQQLWTRYIRHPY